MMIILPLVDTHTAYLWQIDFELTEYESVVSSQDLVNHGQMNDEKLGVMNHLKLEVTHSDLEAQNYDL